jgi:ERCC4-related helicase
MGVDRPNITLFTVPLARGDEASMKPLMDLIPEAARVWKGSDDRGFNPLSLPKSLIFIDDRSKCCSAVTQLQGLFPLWCRSESCNWATEIIREYHSGLSSQGLQKTLALFRKGACRYLVCTEAVGMGLDIPDIERIIQWKLSEYLTMNCWWQRAGRAGRNPNIWAIAVLFYEPQYELPEGSPLSGSRDVESEFGKVKEYMGAQKALTSVVDSPRCKKDRESHMLWYINSRG